MGIEEVVVERLSSRINISTGLTHPLDESAVKEMLKEMVSRGYIFDVSIFEAEAVARGWAKKHAQNIAQLAGDISNGKRVMIKSKGRWNPEVFDEIERLLGCT